MSHAGSTCRNRMSFLLGVTCHVPECREGHYSKCSSLGSCYSIHTFLYPNAVYCASFVNGCLTLRKAPFVGLCWRLTFHSLNFCRLMFTTLILSKSDRDQRWVWWAKSNTRIFSLLGISSVVLVFFQDGIHLTYLSPKCLLRLKWHLEISIYLVNGQSTAIQHRSCPITK